MYSADGIDQIVENMAFLGNRIKYPVKRALYFHLEINHIHPFIDGNGRTARSIEGRLLHEAGLPIPVITMSDKNKYNSIIEDACLAADGMQNQKKILCATSHMLTNISTTLDMIRENGLDKYRNGKR